MRDFLLLRRPLPRRTLVFCHVVAQLTLVVAGLAWLAMHSPLLVGGSWLERWPTLVLGAGIWLLALVGLRLLAELLMLPYHLASLRQGAGAVVTRSFERRPAVHGADGAWVNEAKPAHEPAILNEEAVGNARIVQPRRPFSAHQPPDEADRASRSNTKSAPPSRQEPSL